MNDDTSEKIILFIEFVATNLNSEKTELSIKLDEILTLEQLRKRLMEIPDVKINWTQNKIEGIEKFDEKVGWWPVKRDDALLSLLQSPGTSKHLKVMYSKIVVRR